MSQRQIREDRRNAAVKNMPVASKCLAIVLLPEKKQTQKFESEDLGGDREGNCVVAAGNTLPRQSTTAATSAAASGNGVFSGKDILDDFKRQNRTCYWNPALIESIKKLEYLGFVEPCTVLVVGEDIHLENLRSAWGRRVLKPPLNYTIDRIGDVNGIQMQVIPQTQFIPLPDSLCLIITELNNANQTATLDSIRERLQRWYQNTALPSQQLIYDTLGALIRERKVFHNGTGYCVVTPETYHLPTSDPSSACTASWLPYHPMYIPVFPHPQSQAPLRAPTRSISCQVTHIEEKASSEGSQRHGKSRPRSHSVRACRGKDKAAVLDESESVDFKRAMTVKYKTEKAKAISKDLNLKTSNINQDKDKGEKTSLFSKIFGKKKKKQIPTGTGTASTSSGGGHTNEVEYATFSAQFPPPEWLWYQHQLERQRRTEEWVSQQLVKSSTWQHFDSAMATASSGGIDGSSYHGKARTDLSQPYISLQVPRSQHGHVYATLGPMQGLAENRVRMTQGRDRESMAVNDRRVEEEHRKKQTHRMSGSHTRKEHGHAHHHPHPHRHKEHKKSVPENNYDVPRTHQHVQGFVPASVSRDAVPLNLTDDTIYATPGPGRSTQFVPWHSTPCYDVPSSQPDSHAMPSSIAVNNTAQVEISEVGKFQAANNRTYQRSQRPKRCGHKVYSHYDTGTGNDITIEYKGRMPKKHSHVAQSRDSGVNCIGLPRNQQYFTGNPSGQHKKMESPAYMGTPVDHITVTTVSSLHMHTISPQRGTPCTSMEHRSPEGCSEHDPIINNISGNSAEAGTSGVRSCADSSGGQSNPDHGSTAQGKADNHFQSRVHHSHFENPDLETRLECEGYSQDGTPRFVSMSYCDSSFGEEGAGGGEVILCQAEMHHCQVPQLVLDTEHRALCSSMSNEPDVALSSAGSKDTLEHAAEESERSVETVIHSPNSGGYTSSKYSSELTDLDYAVIQSNSADSYKISQTSHGEGEVRVIENSNVVKAMGSELREVGTVDSGFSSPRNNDNKENQQQHLAPQMQINTVGSSKPEDHNRPQSAHESKHERIKAFVKQSNQMLEQQQVNDATGDSVGNYNHFLLPHSSQQNHYCPSHPKPLHPIQHHQQQLQQHHPLVLNNQHPYQHHNHVRPASQYGNVRERQRVEGTWVDGAKANIGPPNDLQTFQQQQLSGKKFGLNGEFEVVGVV